MGNKMSLDTDSAPVCWLPLFIASYFFYLWTSFPVGAAQALSLIPEEMHREMSWGKRIFGGSHTLNLSPTALGWFAGGISGGSGG